ncbi:hypothetical protein BJX61DRAFT_538758 [Aspergillus egyptiacus]|nr:hypothetical protein BJX61DRAFT_538758 [Aspergillus egyptiacus]
MAETVGVIASAVSLVTLVQQILTSIEKLNTLRTFLRTAPHDLRDLVQELELIHLVLTEFKPENIGFFQRPLVERRLQAFHSSLEDLILEISKYRDTATRNKLGALKLVLKRDILSSHRQSLESIKSTLVLLQQVHFCQQIARKGRNNRKAPFQRQFRFRTPLLFVDKLWTISTTPAYSGWNFTFRVNNVVPQDSPVFQHCQEGKVQEVQRLFSAGLASPFDCDPNGKSLLHIAAGNGHLDLCHLLLASGADSSHRDNEDHTPIVQVDVWVCEEEYDSLEKVALAVDLYWLFIDDAEEDLFGGGYVNPLFSGPPEALSMIQNYSFERYLELPLEIRFERAMALNTWSHNVSADSIRIAIGGNQINPAVFHLEEPCGSTILHEIASGLATEHAARKTKNIPGWRVLLAEAVSASANLHKKGYRYNHYYTPLNDFLYTFSRMHPAGPRQLRSWDDALRIWVSEVKLAGVDLVTYGGNELACYDSMHQPEFPVWIWNRKITRVLHYFSSAWCQQCRMLGFHYGPEPEDWYIWVTNPVDDFAGEFWEMLEREEEIMPGTWID